MTICASGIDITADIFRSYMTIRTNGIDLTAEIYRSYMYMAAISDNTDIIYSYGTVG